MQERKPLAQKIDGGLKFVFNKQRIINKLNLRCSFIITKVGTLNFCVWFLLFKKKKTAINCKNLPIVIFIVIIIIIIIFT